MSELLKLGDTPIPFKFCLICDQYINCPTSIRSYDVSAMALIKVNIKFDEVKSFPPKFPLPCKKLSYPDKKFV